MNERYVPWLGLLALGLLVPQPALAGPSQCKECKEIKETKDVVATAVEAGKFKTLATALKAAGLVEALQGKGPFTVFAPTDAAFAKLPRETLQSLLKPENRHQLVRILKYHVVAGRKDAAAVLASNSLDTLAGPSVHVNQTKGGAFVNQSRLIQTDVNASNGIIHVIDAVLLPPEEKTSADDVKRLLETTVARGSRAYNHGDAEACAQMYQQAIARVLRMSTETVPDAARQRLTKAVRTAERHAEDADARAWALRAALDDVYKLMSERPGRKMTAQIGDNK